MSETVGECFLGFLRKDPSIWGLYWDPHRSGNYHFGPWHKGLARIRALGVMLCYN